MPLTSEEQFLLELINRTRLDPVAEAARFGIDLNAGLGAGTLTGGSRGVLASNEFLNNASIAHSQWMLAADTFSHTGSGGSAPWDRASTAGYVYTTIGENIAFSGTTASSFSLSAAILGHHEGLFRSAGHRVNLVNDSFREIGIARETGIYTSNGTNWNASMLTELFGTSGTSLFITGVAYNDTDGNDFYSMGEGVGGVNVSSGAVSMLTEAAGGYSLRLTAGAGVSVTGTLASGAAFSAKVDLVQSNVKLDIVSGNEFLSSGNLTLLTGIQNATLLGLNNLSLTGSNLANALTGNAGNNRIVAGSGNDTVLGADGNDTIYGNNGNDSVVGGNGSDVVMGGAGNDSLDGGAGGDALYGEAGNDLLTGGLSRDRFIFRDNFGTDVINDYSVAQKDRLVFDDVLWGNAALTDAQILATYASVTAAGVLFDFGVKGSVLVAGVTSTAALEPYLDVI